jgi:hypothetical protein
MQVNVPRTPLENAAKDVLQLVDYMLRNGEWYQAQERADALRAALQQAEPSFVISPPAELKYVISPTRMTWDDAVKWAAGQGLRLATVAEMREWSLPAGYYWSGKEYLQRYAWVFHTFNGYHGYFNKRYDFLAVAVAKRAEPVAYEWDLLSETQAALRDSWALLKKLKVVQDAARALVDSDPDSAADTEGEAFAAWCALVAAIDDADTLLCEFGESNEAM